MLEGEGADSSHPFSEEQKLPAQAPSANIFNISRYAGQANAHEDTEAG